MSAALIAALVCVFAGAGTAIIVAAKKKRGR
jgi:hypothetical protein